MTTVEVGGRKKRTIDQVSVLARHAKFWDKRKNSKKEKGGRKHAAPRPTHVLYVSKERK